MLVEEIWKKRRCAGNTYVVCEVAGFYLSANDLPPPVFDSVIREPPLTPSNHPFTKPPIQYFISTLMIHADAGYSTISRYDRVQYKQTLIQISNFVRVTLQNAAGLERGGGFDLGMHVCMGVSTLPL